MTAHILPPSIVSIIIVALFIAVRRYNVRWFGPYTAAVVGTLAILLGFSALWLQIVRH
jgi:hypothetical protein